MLMLDLFQPGLLSQATMKGTLFELSRLLRERFIPIVQRELEQSDKRDQAQAEEAARREGQRAEEERAREQQRYQAQVEAMREQLIKAKEEVARAREEQEAARRNARQLGEQLSGVEQEKRRLEADLTTKKSLEEERAREVAALAERNARAEEERQAKEAEQQALEAKVRRLEAQVSEVAEKLECKICFETQVELVSLVPCGHVFCEDCATAQLEQNATCPNCRGHIDSLVKLFL